MSALIGALRATLGLDTAAFEKGADAADRRMKKLERSIEGFGKSLSNVGRTLSVAVTAPLVAMGIAAVKAATESRQAIGQVEAALKSMGDGAGRTSAQLQALASGQMRQSLYDDAEILRKVTSNLLTFGNVAGEQFDRAQQAAIDLAARMGTDLQSAALMVGKALNDPAKGLASLRRVGIQFTEQQQAQIKAMAAAGDAAGAQRVMLAELERQFGGSAAAMRAADPMAALKLSFGEFLEQVGAKLLPILPRITEAVVGLLDAFGKLSPGMQTALVAAAGLAAALGPVLMAVGGVIQIAAPFLAFVKTLAVMAAAAPTAAAGAAGLAAGFGSLAASVAAVAAPIAAVAAAGYLIYQNWDKIAPVLEDLWATIQTTIGPPLSRLIDALKDAFTELWQGPLGSMIRAVTPYIVEFGGIVLSVLGTQVVTAIKGAALAIGLAFDGIALAIRAVTALFDGTFRTRVTAAVRGTYEGVQTWLQDKLGAVFEWVAEKVRAVAGWFEWLDDVVVRNSYIPDMVDGIAAEMARLDGVMVTPARNAAKATADAMRAAAGEIKALYDELFPEVRARMDFAADEALIARMPEGLRDEAFRRLWSRFVTGSPHGAGPPDVDMTADPLDQRFEEGFDQFNRRLIEFGERASQTTVRVAKSFKDMAEDTLGSLSRLTSAIKGGGFLGILEAVIGFGLQLGGMGVFGKGIQKRINSTVPGYAGGTGFHPGGLALVGERGPELVSMPRGSRVYSNDNTRAMMGASRVEIVDTTGLFRFRVNGQIMENAPGLVEAGGNSGVAKLQYRASRRWR